MKKSELLRQELESFKKNVDVYVEKCRSTQENVKKVSKDIDSSKDTLLFTSIREKNEEIKANIESIITKVEQEKNTIVNEMNKKIKQAEYQEMIEAKREKERIEAASKTVNIDEIS